MAGNPYTHLVVEAVRNPRGSAETITRMPLPPRSLPMALILVSVLSTLLFFAVAGLAPGSGATMFPGMSGTPAPFALAVSQAGVMLVLAGATSLGGRIAGRPGNFAAALRIVVWWQALMVLMQMAVVVAALVLPPLAGLLGLAALGAGIWMAVGLVAGLHGFRSLVLTALGMIAGLFLLSIALAPLLAPFLPAAP